MFLNWRFGDMDNQFLTLADIAQFLAKKLRTDQCISAEQGGIFRQSDRSVRRLGLALEPFPTIGKWVQQNQIDALWLHRPWRLPAQALPNDIGVVYHHLPFDEHLTMSYNLIMAEAMGFQNIQELGFKTSAKADGTLFAQRPIGMLADAPVKSFSAWQMQINGMFGGYDETVEGTSEIIDRVAVVGAMNEDLVREAAERGATLYLTGQYRPSTQKAIKETGIGVIAVGHRRSEEWGLRALETMLQPVIETVMHTKEPV